MRGLHQPEVPPAKKKPKPKAKTSSPKNQKKLSFKDEHRAKELDELVPQLEAEIAEIVTALTDSGLFERNRDEFDAKSARLLQAREELEAAELEWLEIEEKRDALSA